MNLQRCENGHFYDADKNPVCPHCIGGDRLEQERTLQALPARPSGAAEKNTQEAPDKLRSALGMKLEHNPPPAQNVPQPQRTQADDDERTTQGFWDRVGGAGFACRPVVGWLVCTRGAHRGKDFPLREGKNGVGRDKSMPVCLYGESSVSRGNHTVVVYEPMRNRFYVLPGDASALCYVNGEAVLTQRELKKNDRICVGEATLMLIPCCDRSFNWLIEGER